MGGKQILYEMTQKASFPFKDEAEDSGWETEDADVKEVYSPVCRSKQ